MPVRPRRATGRPSEARECGERACKRIGVTAPSRSAERGSAMSGLAGDRAGVPAGSLTVAGPPEAPPPPGAAPAAAPQGVDAETGFASIGRALADLAAGRPVVVVDDADRENEGDLIFAAEKATPELVSFMVRYTSGYICVALTEADCERLDLPPMHHTNLDSFRTAFTVTVDAKTGITTGISAADRARTI